MTTVKEIEAAIAQLPDDQIDELCEWLQGLRGRRPSAAFVEQWLQGARGVGQPGLTTEQILEMTRGEE